LFSYVNIEESKVEGQKSKAGNNKLLQEERGERRRDSHKRHKKEI